MAFKAAGIKAHFTFFAKAYCPLLASLGDYWIGGHFLSVQNTN